MSTATPIMLALLLIPIALIELGLMVWALIDISKRKYVKGNNKVVWILIIVLVSTIGPILYFFLGRKEGPDEENITPYKD